MNRNSLTTSILYTVTALTFTLSPKVYGQAATPPPTAAPEEEAITLSPFLVSADEDKGGYQATSTLAGTRVRTDLKDVASAISVVTGQFLQDTGAKNNADLLVYTPSTEVAGIKGNFSGAAGTAVYQENTASTSTRVRGLDSADNTRDYFLTDIPWDGYNVGRVDLQRGPNSILFGVGSPAGIINTSTNDASFKTAYHFENRIDQWGSLRNQIDLNQELIKDVLTARFAALNDHSLFQQKPAFNNSTRYYGAMRFDPKLFNSDSHTSIRVKMENGKVDSNNPRQLPPVDEITQWFKTGKDAYGNPGLNKLTINQFSLTNPNPSGIPMPGISSGALANATFQLGGWAQTRSYWPDILNYYEGTDASLLKASGIGNPNAKSGSPIKTIAAQPNTGNAIYSDGSQAGGNVLGGGNYVYGLTANIFRPYGIPSMSQYASYVGGVGATGGFQYPNFAIPGGVYYADNVITDPTIFDFYHKLLDGPNKHEWQKWNSMNVAIDQSFFNDRLAFEVAFDHQTYTQGANQWLTGSNYAITVDVNQTYADGSPNANVGRPYVGNAASAPSLNYGYTTVRDTFRTTVTGELRAEDLFGKTNLAKIIGKHVFTGLYESQKLKRDNVTWAEFATSDAYQFDNNRASMARGPVVYNNNLASNREFDWLLYLGPSLASKSTASGANLSNIAYVVKPPFEQSAINFNSTWNKSTNPASADYVDPTAPYTFTNLSSGGTINSVQAANPANYVGWTQESIHWLFDTNPTDYPGLVQNASRNRYRDISRGATWQGYFLGGDLVPAFGWRKDVITNYQTNAAQDPTSGFTSLSYPDDPSSRTDVRGESKSWGAVYHLPKSWFQAVPGDLTVSVLFNKSKNFKADASRLDVAGNPIPNALGQTSEYGIQITAFKDKLSLKINRFKTKVDNATLSTTAGNSIAGLGNNAYFLADGVIWGYAWAASLQDGLLGNTPGTNYWDYANGSGMPNNTPAEKAAYSAFNAKSWDIVNAWLKLPVPGNYFSSYNLNPPMNPSLAGPSGLLRNAFLNGYADQNGPVPGSGSNFGNHQLTVNDESKGTEIELTAQPTKNWNLSVNYSKVDAKFTNIDQAGQNFIGKMTAFMNGPGGQVREWYNGGGTVGAQWNSSLVAPFTVMLNQLGHEAPEISPWRLNLVTTYSFDRGLLKGVFVGGGLRIEAARILGYKFDPNFKNANSTDPNYAAVASVTLGGLNVDQPLKGPNDQYVDLWFGYSKKLTPKINWRIQANIRNLGEKNKLVAARFQPNGDIALARIQEGMSWQLTNAFDF